MADTARFRKLAIVLLARDEVVSLRETVQGLQAVCRPEDAARILLFLAPDATEACRREAEQLAARPFPIPNKIVQEKGGAIAAELQQLLRGQADASHALIWTSDLDAPPAFVALLLEKAKEHPAAAIRPSRLLPGASLPAEKKGFINWRDAAFARLVRILYRSSQTDPYFGLVLFPIHDFVRFDLREKFMSFALEFALCFERLGTQFIELPLNHQMRQEGKSNLSVLDKLRCFVPMIRVRFLPRKKLFREGMGE
ncbi:MAG: hypothetical protein FWC27_12130 [Firmicutes bacterium]|nr:hypothetical protein [Bacillota bacterium]